MQPVTMTLPFSFSALPIAVLFQRIANSRKRFRLGAVEEPARIDDNKVRAPVLARKLVAFRPQARDDAFAVHQRLRAAERDKTDLWRGAIRFRVGILHGGGASRD